MAISKLLNDNTNNTTNKSEINKCLNNECYCAYSDGKGNCLSEWCLYSQLPKMIITEKEVDCLICEKNKGIISVYSNQVYICPSCKNKLKKLMEATENE